jgi:hypothetical protein
VPLRFTLIFLRDNAVNDIAIRIYFELVVHFVMGFLWERIRKCNDAIVTNGMAFILTFIRINKRVQKILRGERKYTLIQLSCFVPSNTESHPIHMCRSEHIYKPTLLMKYKTYD